MRLHTRLFGQDYVFENLYDVMAKANEEKSGDELAGIAARSTKERVAAKEVLSNIKLKEFKENPAVPYDQDEVTRIIIDALNLKVYEEIKEWTVGELREWLLATENGDREIQWIRRGLTSEMISAVTKLMSNLDLIRAASKIQVKKHCNTTIGGKGILAARLQPNHTTDDPDGIMISLLEGLSYGVGDALIGLNPVDDTVDSVVRVLQRFDEIKKKFHIPTQICVLAHVTTQMEAIRKGAPTDLIFQSIAGSQKSNEAFGITGDMIEEARQLALTHGTAAGPNVMYFETGQGSELSSDGHNGVDQLTMEARCYGFAKKYDPFIVNTVVGFIGPEYLYDSKQVTRAGLEDHFMGKLHGLSMGVDVCYTNHMKADQNDIENLAVLLTAAGCNYFMGVPAGDDIMLNYQTTGYHDIQTLRETLNVKPIKEFEEWLEKVGIRDEDGNLTNLAGDASLFL
ncbi:MULTISPECIES: ethanolamine ammonia-lyase subunit EutB [Cetobacterium]|uniref:ethanolamine ammonia-lyase subunit EutB n=2 Tax=Fusobacteriaceae TaxID=203492 RepID=UPI001F06DABD|nr:MULTISPECIES: ethanolamine ammonia-lyase subunit EutB [Cetobacterium]MCX3066758.1 ethanolamine ammonia-lyase subunit EutB [Cetobacterium somerae]UPO98606.1 ethanolamine ammonia-lyase subunit EutB [Cetobacterium somerae]